MAKKMSRRHGKRGLKKGHKKSAKWRANISAGLKRAWRAGKFKNRKHGKRGHRKARGKKRGRPKGSINYDARKWGKFKRKKRTKYLTRDPKTGKSYY